MRYPAAETAEKHKRILESAARLFRERGVDSVTVGEVMKDAGLTHGPFYNHFDSKQALVAECVEHDLANGAALDRFAGTQKGKAEYLDWYLSPAHRDEPGGGCTIAALSSELRRVPEARAPLTKQLAALVDKLARHFPWSSKRRARPEAIRAMASMVGAVVLSRAVDDQAFSEEILREVRKGLART